MENILIHKTGVITKKEKRITGSVLKILSNSIEIDNQFTLGSFFLMIEKYPELTTLNDILAALLDIALNKYTPGYKAEELESLQFCKTIEVTGFPGKPSLTFYNTLKGVNDEECIDLKFFHLESLLGHRLTLGKLKHIVFGDNEDIFQYKTFYTLFEFVEGVSWELSFNFNPLQCSIRR